MATRDNLFTTIHTEGVLLPPDLLQRIADGANLDGLTPESYHRPGEKLNEAINRAWNALQGAWASFRAAQERLPAGDLGTSVTRERWLLPLFRELDYGRLQTAAAVEIDGRSYPISHRWERVPVHMVSYKVDLDKRTPGVAGAAAASPHSLMQVFLNRTDEHLWGFVSNGHRLRVLRDNASLTRQAYVEFDLEAMMEGEVYSDFVLLWLLCHQSRVEGARPADCWLEKWMKTAEAQGTRALDQLRDGVEAAITALGLGFLEHPANHALRDALQGGALDAQDYYRQLLRMVYRLLFLFVAEDRDLLLRPDADDAVRERYVKYYSTGRLRRLAARFKGTRHHDLYEGLRLVMRLLSGDSDGRGAVLGIAPLGSFLFSDAAVPNVIDCPISNAHLLDAVRALSLVYDDTAKVYRGVDYRNLGPEELGSVYESLLELHPQINVPARRFALATASGHERKTTGSYYTPSELIDALLDSALDPVLDEALKAPDPQAAILNLKVCDPACGSGHFLIAAANRMAKALAAVRTGEEEPPPAAIQAARRDVIGHCIYGVDLNPMAVELCKVNLWMEALEPGKPLSFLDHRIQVGNSLLGTTPRLMAEGIPDDAFNPIEGDDKKHASELRRQNREERKQRAAEVTQLSLFDAAPPADYSALAAGVHALDALDDATIAGIHAKEARHRARANDPEYQKARGLADAWCAAFVWHKVPEGTRLPWTLGESRLGVPVAALTDLLYRRMCENPLDPRFADVRTYVEALRDRYQFFHWHVAFPDVFTVHDDPADAANEQTGWSGGFDVVLGNPPWERIKIQEKEWFAGRNDEIAAAPNAAARRRMIDALKDKDPRMLAAFQANKRQAEGESHFVRVSGRYPLCGRGDVNTYTIFAELDRHVVSGAGRVGVIVPSGIATDDTTKFFFQDLMDTRALVSLYDFENREGLFPAVDSRMKFCLLTLAGAERPAQQGAEFVFFAHRVADLAEAERRFTLSAADIALINPNTGTCPVFRTAKDTELTIEIHKRVPVLVQEEPTEVNPWGAYYMRLVDYSDFAFELLGTDHFWSEGANPVANRWRLAGDMYLPVMESKLIHAFDHRFASYSTSEQVDELVEDEKRDPDRFVCPRYWVSESFFADLLSKYNDYRAEWLLSYRDVARSTDFRTMLSAILPKLPASRKLPILGIGADLPGEVLPANLNAFVFDYVVRQKIGGISVSFFIVKQLPVLPPSTYTPALLAFITPRVLELSYTAWDLQAFAQDVGCDGPPFVWDEARRFLMRCELDALYFHLYQIAREDVDYIMETFPIVRRKDEAAHGEYRTKRVILEMYDQMAALPKVGVPAPKGEGEYLVPDVSQWQTWLSPPPADPRAAHSASD